MNVIKPYAAVLVLIFTNVLIFGGIMWNRSGEPTGELSLNQCEVSSISAWPSRYEANRYLRLSSVSIDIDKDVIEKMQKSESKIGKWNTQLKRRKYVVLKHDGPEWKRHVKNRPSKTEFGVLKPTDSKLIIVDGGDDPKVLANKYADDKNKAIVAGYVFRNSNSARGMSGYWWLARSSRISIESEYRAVTKKIKQANQLLRKTAEEEKRRLGKDFVRPSCIPSHRFTIKWGQRYEPWISSIKEIRNDP